MSRILDECHPRCFYIVIKTNKDDIRESCKGKDCLKSEENRTKYPSCIQWNVQDIWIEDKCTKCFKHFSKFEKANCLEIIIPFKIWRRAFFSLAMQFKYEMIFHSFIVLFGLLFSIFFSILFLFAVTIVVRIEIVKCKIDSVKWSHDFLGHVHSKRLKSSTNCKLLSWCKSQSKSPHLLLENSNYSKQH